ncbi:MAG: FHA domain-containing protein [Anaerolineales bacterium]|nr:FHA domain-containing protein [Anaerolineales bacterium]
MTQNFEFHLHIQGPETSWEMTLPEGPTLIGRQAGCSLLLENPQISRQHARMDCSPLDLQITDLGSSNGTFVDDTQLTPQVSFQLSAGVVIKVGPFSITVAQTPIQIPESEPQHETREQPITPIREPVALGEEPHPLEKGVPEDGPAAPPPRSTKPRPEKPGDDLIPPGLSIHSKTLINYLPDIYQTDFMSRYLGIFEAILTPIEWNVDHFDLYLSPGTAPAGFLPWLSSWYEITFDPTWDEGQRRKLLKLAHRIYARRGTRWALAQVLEIYTGKTPEIIDQGEGLAPFTFIVNLLVSKKETNPELVEALIDNHKPAHTTYKLNFVPV